MRALELLKIKYLAIEGFELFETYEASSSSESSSSEGGTTSLEVPQPLQVQLMKEPSEQPGDEPNPELVPLWNAQSTVIYEQNERLDIIYVDLENKREGLEGYTFDWGEILLEGFLETGIEWILKKYLMLKQAKDLVIPDALEFLIDWAIESVPKAIGFLIQKYRQARSEIGALKTENNELLALQKSWDNYHLRLEVLKHHEEAIENLLNEIIEHEKPLNMVSQDYSAILEKIENSLSGRAEEGEDDELEEFWEDVEDQLDKMRMPVEEEEEEEDTERHLPALPPKYPANTLTRFLHALLRMEAYKMQEIAQLNENIELLQFNGQRLHLPNGDIVELTGIGTVTATPDQF